MARNKSKQARRADEEAKPQSAQGISWKVVGGILLSIGTLVSLLVGGLDFINYLREGYQQFLWLGVAVLGVIWLIILWLLFKQRNIYWMLYLMVTILAGVVIWNGWHSYVQTREGRLIVLIAKFDDTRGDYYELRNEIYDTLRQDFENYADVQVEKVNEIITEDSGSGSPRARDLGNNYQADLVIWGSYRQTENPNIKIHIENLASEKSLPIDESATLKPRATLAELESFTFQQKAGQETSALISFLSGFMQFRSSNYTDAIVNFDIALENLQDKSHLIADPSKIYYYRAFSNLLLEKFELAIIDANNAIQFNPQMAIAYLMRGGAYSSLGSQETAIQDFNKALDIEPNLVVAYNNRALSFADLKQYDQAIRDETKAIELNPNYLPAFNNRGAMYIDLSQYEQAILDFDKAIELDPDSVYGYINRGYAYSALGKSAEALLDYSKAINLEPNNAYPYIGRGVVYFDINQYDHAFQDYSTAIDLAPEEAIAYAHRGDLLNKLGQYERAIEDFDQVIYLNSATAFTYNSQSFAYSKLGKYLEAIQDLDRALELDPTLADAYFGRGSIYQILGRTAEAEADFKKYEELTGEKP